jgi:hypothetical protein
MLVVKRPMTTLPTFVDFIFDNTVSAILVSRFAVQRIAPKMKAPKQRKLTSRTKPPKASGILGTALLRTNSMGIRRPETPTGMASVIQIMHAQTIVARTAFAGYVGINAETSKTQRIIAQAVQAQA